MEAALPLNLISFESQMATATNACNEVANGNAFVDLSEPPAPRQWLATSGLPAGARGTCAHSTPVVEDTPPPSG